MERERIPTGNVNSAQHASGVGREPAPDPGMETRFDPGGEREGSARVDTQPSPVSGQQDHHLPPVRPGLASADPSAIVLGQSSAAGESAEAHHRKYQDLFHFAPDGYVVTDAAGTIIEANSAFIAMLRLGDSSLPGKPFSFFIHPEERLTFESSLRILQRERRLTDLEMRLSSSRRRDLPVSATISRMDGWTGDGVRLLWLLRDLTERKNIEAEQVELKIAYFREQRIAETLQRSMLETRPRDAFPGLAVTTSYEAAFEESRIGGDFYDSFALDDSRVGLVVGDVSGKGLAAAVHTMEVRFAIRHILREGAGPGCALARVNELLYRGQLLDRCDRPRFAAAAIVVVNGATGDLTVSSAGCAMLIVRQDGGSTLIPTAGIPMGLFGSQSYADVTHRLNPGDMVVLATDGVNEARSAGKLLGWEGALEIVLAARAMEAHGAVADAVLEGAKAFCGGVLQDDACVLVAEKK